MIDTANKPADESAENNEDAVPIVPVDPNLKKPMSCCLCFTCVRSVYLGRHADNALVARHYTGACSHIFHYCLKQSGLYHRAVELLVEMERLTKKYCASYRELGKTDDFCDYFFGAIGGGGF